ncbi:MAG: type 4a pilus biogenesis protein PilO [Terriglobia bacterium]
MAKRRGQQWFLGALVLLLVLDAGVYFGLVQPLASMSFDEKTQAALAVQVERAQAEVARLGQIERDLPATTTHLDQFVTQHFLAEQAGYSAIVEELERAAAAVGVRPGRVDFHPYAVRERPELVRIEIETTVEGRYQSLLGFLGVLERSANFYLLQRLDLASATRGGSLKLNLKLDTYLRKRT